MLGTSLMAQAVKNLPVMQELWVQSRGLRRSLEEEMATHESILVGKNPRDRGACWATVHRVAESWTQLSTRTHVQDVKLANLTAKYAGMLFKMKTCQMLTN